MMVYDENMGTKEKLIYAAGRCLLEKGSHAASVKTIASMAGVNHGLVHHYFGSKEGLFIALLKKYFELIIPSSVHIHPSRDELISYLAETVILNSRMMIELRALSFHMPELDRELILLTKELRRRLMSILGINYDKAILLQGAVSGLGFQSSLDTSLDVEKYIRMIVDLVNDN